METEDTVPEENQTLVNIDGLNVIDGTFGVQYGYHLPGERVIPLPVGVTEPQAVTGVARYNAATGRRSKVDRAVLVERIVTEWIAVDEEEKPVRRVRKVTAIKTGFGVAESSDKQ